MDVKIVDGKLSYLNPAAERELERRVKEYARDLLNEAGRLEGAQRSAPGEPEITSTIVRDANTGLRRTYVRPARSKWLVFLQAIAYLGAIAAGVAGTELDQGWGPIVFVIAVCVGILSVAIIELRK